MKEEPFLAVALAIVISGALAAGAQNTPKVMQSQQPTLSSSGAYSLHVDAEEVVLNCTVLDSKREPVNDLTRSNFKVFEDKALQTVISLQHQDTPVSIGLLVDNSGSMSTKRTAVGSAALDLVKASNPHDETFVINFSDQAYLDQDFTSDIRELQNGLAHLSQSGGTALYDN
jgi:VWFA-related protein